MLERVLVCTLPALAADPGKSGSLGQEVGRRLSLRAKSILADEFPRKTSRAKIKVTVP